MRFKKNHFFPLQKWYSTTREAISVYILDKHGFGIFRLINICMTGERKGAIGNGVLSRVPSQWPRRELQGLRLHCAPAW